MLNVLDEFTHECLAIRVARKLKAIDVIDVLSDLLILRGIPANIRSDNGPEFVAKAGQEWIAAVGAKTAYIERGSPWENGYIESFNARLRDELLNGEIFYTLRQAQIVIESWRLTPQSDTSHQHQGCLCLHSPRGRLRYADRLRRPRGRNGQLKLTFHLDHSVGADHARSSICFCQLQLRPLLFSSFLAMPLVDPWMTADSPHSKCGMHRQSSAG